MKKFIRVLLETLDILWKIIGITLLWWIPFKIITHYWWWTIFIFLGLVVLSLFYTIWKAEE